MALFIGPFWVLLCIFWLNSVVFWGNSWLRFNAEVSQRFLYNFYTFRLSCKTFFWKISHIGPILHLIFTLQFYLVLIALFCFRAIRGWVWDWDRMGSDPCVGWLYEHRFAVLKGPKNSGKGKPPTPLTFGQCPNWNVFFVLMSSLSKGKVHKKKEKN